MVLNRDTTSISFQELLGSNTLARGLAIGAVVMCHIPNAHAFWAPLWTFASAGKLAVSIFLFSSGLLLQHQVNRTGGRFHLSTWLKKRFFRIYPLYWAGLALTLYCAVVFQHRIFDVKTILANVLGFPLFLHQRVISCGFTEPFWFISLLLLCYVIFVFTCRLRNKGFLVLFALALSFVALCYTNIIEAASLAFPSFFMGMWVTDWMKDRGQRPSDVRIHVALFLPILGILAFVYKRGGIFMDVRCDMFFDLAGCVCLTIITLPTLYIIAYAQKLLERNFPLLLRRILWVSALSFAVYCVHEPLLLVLRVSTGAGHQWVGLLSYVFLTIFVAWMLNVWDKKLRHPRDFKP
ncbi:MAG: acyltransferase [bacterium]